MGQQNLGTAFAENPAGDYVPLQVDAEGGLIVAAGSGVTQISGASGNVAAAPAVATLPAAAGKTTYISGFSLSGAGATAAAVVLATVTGLIGGTMTFVFVFPAGVTVLANPLTVNFSTPIAASAPNTAIVVTLPSGGSGNTNAAANAWGFQQ